METIDLTPSPLGYATIALRIIEGGYDLDAQNLTNYQALWAWQAAENAAPLIGDPLHELPRKLATELLRFYLARAHTRPAIVITSDTTYEDLASDSIRQEGAQ
ncbi:MULTISPECIES: hypothetical protein [Bacteria]